MNIFVKTYYRLKLAIIINFHTMGHKFLNIYLSNEVNFHLTFSGTFVREACKIYVLRKKIKTEIT